MEHVKPIELVKLLEAAERRWFHTAIRARTPDGERLEKKKLFMVRVLTLVPRWRRIR